MIHTTVCDGEKVYLIISKRVPIEHAIEEAERMLNGSVDVTYADKREYGQYTICKQTGEYYCLSKKEE